MSAGRAVRIGTNNGATIKYLSRSLMYGLYLALCTDEKEFNRELKRLKTDKLPPFMGANGHATTHYLQQGDRHICIVCIKRHKGKSRHEINGLLVHEATHVWQRTREIIGEDAPSSEFEAYAMQNISQQLMMAYWK